MPPFHPTGTFKPRKTDPAPVPSPPPPYNPPTTSSLFRRSDRLTDLTSTYASSLQPHSRRRTRAQGQSATDQHTATGPRERSERYEQWERDLIRAQKAEEKGVKVENGIVDAAVRIALERRQQEEILNELTKERLEKERKRERLLRVFKTQILEAEVRKRKEESDAKRREEGEKRLREEVEKRRSEELLVEKKIKEWERMWKRDMQRKMREEAERRMREEMRKKAERDKIWRARFDIDVLEEREIITPKEKKRYGRYFYKGSDGKLIEWVWDERR